MTRVATCTGCGDVLVVTFAWRGQEFVCLGCGRLHTYFGPKPADETPELLERISAREAEWSELSAGLLSGGVKVTACRDAGGRCGVEPHVRHATPEELAAHEAAVARIGERLGRVPA